MSELHILHLIIYSPQATAELRSQDKANLRSLMLFVTFTESDIL